MFPVGRLDADSEGLLILTNDGELAQRLTHPSFGVEKEYLVEMEGAPSPGALRRLRQGVELDDGMTAPATVGVVAPGVLRIVIHEGRNRQVRRMCEAVGHPVRRLVRTRIGPLSDPRLRRGSGGRFGPAEVRALAAAADAPRRPWPAPRAARVAAPGLGSMRAMSSVRALRGATTVDADTPDQVSDAHPGAAERTCSSATRLEHDDVISIVFTATGDVVSMFPAAAARAMGLGDVPCCAPASSTSWGRPPAACASCST